MLNNATPRRLTFIVIALVLGILLGLALLPSGNAAGAAVSGFCSSVTEIPETECEALEVLYNSTNGAGWTDSAGWLVTSTPCTWEGITCSSGHVTSITLSNNELQGPLPAEIGSLPSLQALLLNNNGLTGSIPADIGLLSNLTRLNLASNQLNGPIPAEIGSLSNLRDLSFAYNGLTGSIPTQIGLMSNLIFVELISNTLEGPIPAEIGDLSQLTYLDLTGNMLTGTIPSTLGAASLLGEFYVEGNQLYGAVPDGLCDGMYKTTLSYNKLDPLQGQSCLDAAIADDWEETQTLPPNDVSATSSTAGAIELTWTIVSQMVDIGHYEVLYATISGGPYTLHGQTLDKVTNSYKIEDLDSSADLFFVLRTVTPPHDKNQNELVSAESAEAPSKPNAINLTDFSASQPFPFLPVSLVVVFALLYSGALFILLKRPFSG